MMLPHLSPWAGATAGLRVVDAFMAVVAACAYRHVLERMARRRFTAKGSDVMGGGLAIIALGILVQTLFGIVLIFTKGSVPADAVLWSRLMVAASYLLCNLGFTVIFAGMTTRAWVARGASPLTAAQHGRQMYFRLAQITALMMAFGAFVSWRS